MFRKLFFIWLLIINSLVKEIEPKDFSNTSNSCYYAIDKSIRGDLITQIVISGSSIDQKLATCCYMCRALPDCIAWRLVSTTLLCQFFKTVTNIYSSANHYSGKIGLSEIWNCTDIVHDKYYSQNGLWSLQTDSKSHFDMYSCCSHCFWTFSRPKCVSWMYNRNTNEWLECQRNIADQNPRRSTRSAF